MVINWLLFQAAQTSLNFYWICLLYLYFRQRLYSRCNKMLRKSSEGRCEALKEVPSLLFDTPLKHLKRTPSFLPLRELTGNSQLAHSDWICLSINMYLFSLSHTHLSHLIQGWGTCSPPAVVGLHQPQPVSQVLWDDENCSPTTSPDIEQWVQKTKSKGKPDKISKFSVAV